MNVVKALLAFGLVPSLALADMMFSSDKVWIIGGAIGTAVLVVAYSQARTRRALVPSSAPRPRESRTRGIAALRRADAVLTRPGSVHAS